MERKTFKILFFIKKTRVSNNGEVPVLLRVTVNGLRTETSVNLKVNPDLWHAPTGKTLGTDRKFEELKNEVVSISIKVVKRVGSLFDNKDVKQKEQEIKTSQMKITT